jgi:FkbM family methyltransferase
VPTRQVDRPSGLTLAERRSRLLDSRNVDLVIDVGANTGQYALAARDSGYDRRIVSFEPLAAAFIELQAAATGDSLWTCHQLGLGQRSEARRLNVAADSVCSSFLATTPRARELESGTHYVATELVQVRPLAGIWPDIAAGVTSGYLKVDVQGYELEVIAGAAGVLSAIQAIELELSLSRMYQGMPLAPEAIAVLSKMGFRLFAFECIFDDPQSGEMLQLDTIFVRQADL